MVFYKGALTYSDLNKISIPEIIKWQKLAERINKEREQQEKAAMRKK